MRPVNRLRPLTCELAETRRSLRVGHGKCTWMTNFQPQQDEGKQGMGAVMGELVLEAALKSEGV